MHDARSNRARSEEDDNSPSAWSPAITVAVTLVPGVIGVLTGQLLLFPSLGPTVVMQAHLPRHASSRFYNIVVAHLVGLAAGDLCVFVLGLAGTPSVFAMHALSPARVIAAALSLLLAITLEVSLRASHPPAAATTLLSALGSFRIDIHDTMAVVVGVLIVAVVGELVRQARLRSIGGGEHD
jgi:HPP family protein